MLAYSKIAIFRKIIFKKNNANKYISNTFRFLKLRYKYIWSDASLITLYRKSLPPYNISIAQGSTHIIACRGFIDYILHNPIANDLLEWMNDTHVPDEHYFATLNHNRHLQVPGGYKGNNSL